MSNARTDLERRQILAPLSAARASAALAKRLRSRMPSRRRDHLRRRDGTSDLH
jgi:hypothetical protein